MRNDSKNDTIQQWNQIESFNVSNLCNSSAIHAKQKQQQKDVAKKN